MILVEDLKCKNAISFEEWRKRIIRSQYGYPEIRFIPKISVNCKNDQQSERSNLGSKRIDEVTSCNTAA